MAVPVPRRSATTIRHPRAPLAAGWALRRIRELAELTPTRGWRLAIWGPASARAPDAPTASPTSRPRSRPDGLGAGARASVRAARRRDHRLLEHPGATQPRLAVDGGHLPLRLRAADSRVAGLDRGPQPGAAQLSRAAGRAARGRVLRRRPDDVASLDRRRRRRSLHGAGQHPGGAGAAGRLGDSGRAARQTGADGAAGLAASACC